MPAFPFLGQVTFQLMRKTCQEGRVFSSEPSGNSLWGGSSNFTYCFPGFLTSKRHL
uniref:Uncharacterized protein n=1 Tax=Anguilla anguilla TaxID=7936 RepID=A0A0E9W4P9_ANGAN